MYLLFSSTRGKLMEGIIFICFLHFSISSALEKHLTQNNIMIFIPMTNSGGKKPVHEIFISILSYEKLNIYSENTAIFL